MAVNVLIQDNVGYKCYRPTKFRMLSVTLIIAITFGATSIMTHYILRTKIL